MYGQVICLATFDNVLIIYQVKMSNIYWFHLLKCQNIPLVCAHLCVLRTLDSKVIEMKTTIKIISCR